MTKLYKRSTLGEFYAWQGINGSPAEGTVNYILGINSNNSTKRYTYPMIHKDSTCEYDDYNMPIAGTIEGDETDVIYLIDSKCPDSKIDELGTLLSEEEVEALGWFNEEE